MRPGSLCLAFIFLIACHGAPDESDSASRETLPTPPVTLDTAGGLFRGTELLSRPTDHSVTLTVTATQAIEAQIQWGTTSGSYPSQTAAQPLAANQPLVAVLDGLLPNTRYFYRLRYRRAGEAEFTSRSEHAFHTQRAPGSTFAFVVQADSHLGTLDHCEPNLYIKTLLNEANSHPDFFIDLGDTFRQDKVKGGVDGFTDVESLYIAQRAFLGLVGHSSPVFLAVGNHEHENGWELDGSPDNPPRWAAKARKLLYPQPRPDAFYTGNGVADNLLGPLENYYAWTWGDALFVVLDPYWYTTSDPKVSGDNWDWTLGKAQYDWLKTTLEKSGAPYKFVFAHHVQGDGTRGGIEPATKFEWGGANKDGSPGFAANRPGWPATIQQLMARNGVTFFVQGHDHIFVRQELDGVVYQTCPMPGEPGYSLWNSDAFQSGDRFPNSGHVRFTISPAAVKVEYVRSWLPGDETQGHTNAEVAYSYTRNRRP